MPSHPVARELLARRSADGIAAPSANRFGRISPTTAAACRRRPRRRDRARSSTAARATVGIESTIVAFVAGEPMLLRPGGVPLSRPRARAGPPARYPPTAALPAHRVRCASHYAPRTRSALLAPDVLRAEIVQLEDRDEDIAVLARTVSRPSDFDDVWLRAPLAQRGVRARSLREPAHARRGERGRDPDRSSAGRRRVARRPRPPCPRDARRRRRPGLGPVNAMGACANEWPGAPIAAADDAKTRGLGEESNNEWRPRPHVPFGLLPKTPIAALQSLAGCPTRLRLRALRWPFSAVQRVCVHSVNRP